jgi:hypothetical protein
MKETEGLVYRVVVQLDKAREISVECAAFDYAGNKIPDAEIDNGDMCRFILEMEKTVDDLKKAYYNPKMSKKC